MIKLSLFFNKNNVVFITKLIQHISVRFSEKKQALFAAETTIKTAYAVQLNGSTLLQLLITLQLISLTIVKNDTESQAIIGMFVSANILGTSASKFKLHFYKTVFSLLLIEIPT